jgi:hypothetical protein
MRSAMFGPSTTAKITTAIATVVKIILGGTKDKGLTIADEALANLRHHGTGGTWTRANASFCMGGITFFRTHSLCHSGLEVCN